jgi:putative ABC transport system permease protein
MALRADAALRAALTQQRSRPGTTIVLALVALAMSFATFATAGSAAAAEADVAASVEAAAPRLITMTVTEPHPGADRDAVARIESLGHAEWVLALGPARDVRSAEGVRANVAARTLLSPLPDLATIQHGAAPEAGDAIVSESVADRLQLEHPVGRLIDGGVMRAIVGEFTASGSIESLDRLVLVGGGEEASERATLIYLLADDATAVAGIVQAVRAVAGIPPEQLQIQTSDRLIELADAVSGTIGGLARQLALGAITTGVVLTALTVTLSLNSRRRDFGRRRALGASRSALVALILLEVAIPITAGTVVGSIAGWCFVSLTGAAPPASFVLSASALIAILGTAAAAPPSVRAAFQDPMRILRVP